MTLPRDLDIGRPCSSSVQPCVSTRRYGARSRIPTLISNELWNQPRYWSGPSRYISAGQGNSALGLPGGSSTARCDDPESNQTSRISLSLRHFAQPQSQAVPLGSSSSAGCVYQASAPSFSNQRITCRSAAKSSSLLPHLSQ